jgi:ABC-type Fe3+-hydroxamate transport system substrate-binding protein
VQVRRLTLCLAVVLSLTACAGRESPPASSTSSTPTARVVVNPANIKRIRSALPSGYEIADVTGPVSIAGLWGFGPGWSADPPQCVALADPAPGDGAARGYSASGQGGTVYVVVAAAPAAPDAGLLAECAQWTMTFAHTTGDVTVGDPPRIEGADTVGLGAATRTVVESGRETNGQASTVQAYLDGHVVFVTLVTDPGSHYPPLTLKFITDLLTATVTALRS